MWDGKEINFVPKSDVEFFCKEQRFPLKFIKDNTGNVDTGSCVQQGSLAKSEAVNEGKKISSCTCI
jgi:hypothetical protein